MNNIDNDFINSTEFQQIIENSIIENSNTLNNTSYLEDNYQDIEFTDALPDSYKNFKDKQDKAYVDSLKIDKAKLYIAKSIQRIYSNNLLLKKALNIKCYQNYKNIQKKKGGKIRNITDLNWKNEYDKYLQKEELRQKRLNYFNK